MNLDILIALNIKERVDASLRNVIVTDISTELKTLVNEINQGKAAISEVISGFKKIGIEADRLEFEECELNIAIPREYVNNDLNAFGKEIGKINIAFVSLSEILKEEHRGFEIRSISSTDLTVAININVDLADLVLYSLIGIKMIFHNMEDKQNLIDNISDLPDELSSQLKDWATSQLGEKTTEMVDNIREQFGGIIDVDKYEQYKGSVRDTILDLVERLQNGVNIEVNIGDSDDESDEDTDDDAEVPAELISKRNRLKELSKKSAELTVLQLQKNPIFNIEHLKSNKDEITEPSDDETP